MKADQVAIVFGSTIHLHNTDKAEFLNNREWLCHELKHVEQYQQYGFTGFIARYLLEWVKKGYYNNRFEMEARNNEGNTNLIKQAFFLK